jgi:hypothetical protein
MIDHLTRQYFHSALHVLYTAGPLGPEWAELNKWRFDVAIPDDQAQAAVEGVCTD